MQNVGGIDRILRIAVGIGLVAAAASQPDMTWAWLGVVPLGTGLVGFCPFYPLLKISTARKAARAG